MYLLSFVHFDSSVKKILSRSQWLQSKADMTNYEAAMWQVSHTAVEQVFCL
jgi:hypothetical protein